MTVSSVGGLSGESSNKRPIKDGYFPKCKPRKKFAKRDFPSGCGPKAVVINFKHEEDVGCEDNISESGAVKDYEVGDVVIADGLKNLVKPNLLEVGDVENFEMVNCLEADSVSIDDMQQFVELDDKENADFVIVGEPSDVRNSNVEVDCWPHCVNSPIEVAKSIDELAENDVTTAVDGFSDVEESMIEIRSSGTEFLNEVECQTLEALDQLVALGEAEMLDSSVEKETKTMDGFCNGVEDLMAEFDYSEKQPETEEGHTMLTRLNEREARALIPNSDAEVAKPVLEAGTSIDELSLLCSTQSPSSFHSCFKVGISVIPKDKYRQRRVSAVRNFPPCCGANFPLSPTEEKQHMITSVTLNQDGVKKIEVENARRGTDSGLLRMTLMEIPVTTAFLEEKGSMLVGELVSFEECNRKLKENNIEEEEARRSELGSGTMLDNIDEKNRTPVRNETAVSSLNRSHKIKAQHSISGSDDKVVPLNCNLKAHCLGQSSKKKTAVNDSYATDGSPGSSSLSEKDDYGVDAEDLPYLTPVPIRAVPSNTHEDTAGPVGKEIIVYSPEKSDNTSHSQSVLIMTDEVESEIVHGLVAAPYCPWKKEKGILKNSDGGTSGGKLRKQNLSVRKVKAVAKKSSSKMNLLEEQHIEQRNVIIDVADGSPQASMLTDEEGLDHHEKLPTKYITVHKTQDIDVNLLPFGPNNSSQGDSRNRVRETLRMFHTICRKLLQKEEANLIPEEEGRLRETDKKFKRIDLLSAKIIKGKGKEVNTEKQIFGQVPGVEVGDEFQYRVELAIVGIHRLYQAGIDWLKVDGTPIATSIVASGAYADDLENADVLIYSGQGGNVVGKVKNPEDQKLERGNLALRNSISAQTPVRVVRGWKETKVSDLADSKPKTVTIYVYDGLYTIERYWTETGPHGKQVFMFELRRNPGQPELAWKELKSSSKSKIRPGVCVDDVSGGKESIPICAVNAIDDAKPPPFNYTRKMIYPDWFCPVPPEGCKCTGRCGDGKECPCAVRNGGEIPYNRNGAIVEAKPLVFECGPSCKCPPSCYNRVTQRGIKFRIEIFKTESRGWGVRSLNSIPSGSFICEYAGELLEDKEAEQRIDNDEYLFDIGQNYNDFSLKPEEQESLVESVEEAGEGYTIDAGKYGNTGRFINHSCSPNLYAQNVIYDHDDNRMPHVMLFAAENIPPLQELTYHYNYAVDQVHDSNGNIKVKKCYCGSAECTGRMY